MRKLALELNGTIFGWDNNLNRNGVDSIKLGIWTFQVSPLIGDNFSMAGCMGMLLVDSVFYGILMWYIEAVFPGEFGVPKPWYFFLTKSYWMSRPTTLAHYDSDPDMQLGERPKQNEAEPTHLPLGSCSTHWLPNEGVLLYYCITLYSRPGTQGEMHFITPIILR